MKIIILSLILCCVVGCNELDGSYVSDSDGNIYKLNYRIGQLYYPEKIDIEALKTELDKAGKYQAECLAKEGEGKKSTKLLTEGE